MNPRTCVVCRVRRPAGELTRVSADAHGLVGPWPAGHAPGRGAWLCPRTTCLSEAEARPGRLMKALARPTLVTTGLGARVRSARLDALLHALEQARRAGVVVAGVRSIEEEEGLLVGLVASDAGPGVPSRVRLHCSGTAVRVPLTSVELGKRLGCGPRSGVGVRPSKPGRTLAQRLRLLVDLG